MHIVLTVTAASVAYYNVEGMINMIQLSNQLGVVYAILICLCELRLKRSTLLK